MNIQCKKPQFKAIVKNPLADKLKAKHAKAILEARLKKRLRLVSKKYC